MAEKQNQVHDATCGAKTRAGTPCQQPAGWGTNHVGSGRCKLHGGKSTGPKEQSGNKNATKTGEHETIWFDALDTEEQSLFAQIRTNAIDQLDNEIRLTEIRERRMMMRIKEAKAQVTTLVKETSKQGTERGQDTDVTEEERQASFGLIHTIEEALTRVQGRKAKLIELKHKIETGDEDDGSLDALAAALKVSAKRFEADTDD